MEIYVISDQAMNQIRNNLTTLQQAYNRYIQEANSVGLDEAWASKVRDGSINIETITDESLMDKIKDYENWYNKAKTYEQFLDESEDKNLLLLEIGVGFNTPRNHQISI